MEIIMRCRASRDLESLAVADPVAAASAFKLFARFRVAAKIRRIGAVVESSQP